MHVSYDRQPLPAPTAELRSGATDVQTFAHVLVYTRVDTDHPAPRPRVRHGTSYVQFDSRSLRARLQALDTDQGRGIDVGVVAAA